MLDHSLRLEKMAEFFWHTLENTQQQIVLFAPRIAAALLVVVVAILVGRLLGSSLTRFIEWRNLTQTHRAFFRNLVQWLTILLGMIIALDILGLETALAGFLAGSGVAAIVLGFAFREIGENLLAGLFLAFSRPFNVGDFILSADLEGEIREIELRYTHIRTVDGRDIYIPNAQMFNRPLTNYTRDGLRRPSFRIGIDYSDDTDKARHLLLKAVGGVPDVLDDPGPSVAVVALAPSYVELEIGFWLNTFRIGGVEKSPSRIEQEEALTRIRSQIMETCRRTLIDNDFTVSANVSTNVSLVQYAPKTDR